MDLASLEADAASFFTMLGGWAINQHQKTEDAGFAAIARLAGKASVFMTENATDIAAVKAFFAQVDSPVQPAATRESVATAPVEEPLPKHYAGEHGTSIYEGQDAIK